MSDIRRYVAGARPIATLALLLPGAITQMCAYGRAYRHALHGRLGECYVRM